MKLAIPVKCGLTKFERMMFPIIFAVIVMIVALEVKHIQADASNNIPFTCFDVEVFIGVREDESVISKTEELCAHKRVPQSAVSFTIIGDKLYIKDSVLKVLL